MKLQNSIGMPDELVGLGLGELRSGVERAGACSSKQQIISAILSAKGLAQDHCLA